jgi:membrane carboxypeptidase/penicillin-binding protein
LRFVIDQMNRLALIAICKPFQFVFRFCLLFKWNTNASSVNNTIGRILTTKDFQNFSRLSCSDVLIKYLVAGEDTRFLTHCGVDYYGICRAIKKYIFCDVIEGASTIEMQLVRTIMEDYRFSFMRKFKEIVVASSLYGSFTKREIALCYAWLAYYGWGMVGIVKACKSLNMNMEHLNDEDCALLVALIKYPFPRFRTEAHLSKLDIRKKHILKVGCKHERYK